VARAYTPLSSDRDLGRLDLLVKVYWPTERFPRGGKMTQHLAALKVRAPRGRGARGVGVEGGRVWEEGVGDYSGLWGKSLAFASAACYTTF